MGLKGYDTYSAESASLQRFGCFSALDTECRRRSVVYLSAILSPGNPGRVGAATQATHHLH
jgi:hypothetical protein